ncbi:MAG: hypothetical protein HY673_11150 [Chloroflexi bacterium]|nr:hypothetical protein [Chloroflexota bacterium]
MKEAFVFCKRRWVFLGLMLAVLFAQTSPPVKADSFFGVARPYYFSIARWELENLWKKWQYQLFNSGAVATASATDQIQTVAEYFRLGDRARRLQQELDRHRIQPGQGGDPETVKKELAEVNGQRAAVRSRVVAIIEGQISDTIMETDIYLEWGFPRLEVFFPPVTFELTPLPNVLIVSPREKIEIKDSLLLKPTLSPEEIAGLEKKQEKLGHSAVVDSIGGVATYPAMVTDSSNLEFTVRAAAHEWVHHYLFLRPMGQKYGSDYRMLTLNESTADIIGGEVAGRVLKTYGIFPEKKQARNERKRAKDPGAEPQGFNFNREMRQIRLAVDDYLAKGEIEQAERFMEERRQFLASQGYYIRKLNQAYFAFHGSYSESPSSSSPIAGELASLRQRYSSLGEFARAVSGVSSYAEYRALLGG